MEEMKKRFTDFIGEREFALLKSQDEYYLSHYLGSPLNLMTGFSGTAGEAIIDKDGKITLFVDPRYHEQADFETKGKNVDVVKLKMGQRFSGAIKEIVKDSVLYLSESSTYDFYKNLEANKLNLKIYKDFCDFGKNLNLDETKEVFPVALSDFTLKLKKLKKCFRGRYLLLTSVDEISYLVNLRSFKMPNTSTFKAKLLLDFKGENILYCDYKINNLPLELTLRPLSEFRHDIEKIKEPISTCTSFLTMGDFEAISNMRPLKNNPVAKLASIKEEKEIEHYKYAFKQLDLALLNFKKRIRAGLSELRLKEIFEEELLLAGAKTTSFKTILAIADNSSSIHYSNYDENKILKEGDLILLDCGGYWESGLATDITRVFLCGTKANGKQKEIYTAVLKAFLNAYHANCLTGGALDKIARKILKPYEKEGFLFPHALGHGIGIPVHQSPPTITSVKGKKFFLKKNMTHTIEPGLYCENEPHKFGVRLENSVYVTGLFKRKSFSAFEFEENLIERKMLNKKEINWLNDWQKTWEEVKNEN